ncbi:hypothetical protein OEA41_005703 [Lepraria neglecta]|uniref:Phosphatidic acid phosphatase type 2/haloperoxidase domain-containing protein n=1 Tax=Lepraria neglecta TaxID=209136 RepID=A0AAD9Z943_9LECA|nr:hypothetical protein OEA41_005703 [Lepraria neglecta]
MDSVAGSEEMAKPEGLLEPLPTLNVVKCVEKLDAGLRSLDHYRTKLPLWRYEPRQRLIPLVRWETPHLAAMQKAMRSPALDTYFSTTANLGTHTFFMIFLPILFWCGYTNLGRGLVHVLASGVFFSGFLKDMWCLPRPLSPPLKRITMSHSTALEYGFPSTHSTNAVSVAVYALFMLHSPDSSVHPTLKLILEVVSCCYATSIILGRIYCGMHGFFDVLVGSVLGALLSIIQCLYGDNFDHFIHTGTFKAPTIVVLIILVLVRIHPEPADDCPCFDDSVAFAGVMIGIELGNWHFGRSGMAWDEPVLATVPFNLSALGWPRTIARILIGVLMVFAWREIMKPALLRILPPVFRVVESLGLNLPRRFFVQASEYNKVPNQLKDDNVIPSVSEIPSLLTSIRHPRRSRSVSIGPQSEADAYETLAYRAQLRRESKSDMKRANPGIDEKSSVQQKSPDYFGISTSSASGRHPTAGLLPTPASSNLDLYKSMTEAETTLYTPLTPSSSLGSRRPSAERRQDEKEEKEMFSKLEKPRVRYDVEVITKLIVYTGIAWIAVEGGPILFATIGLGLEGKPP